MKSITTYLPPNEGTVTVDGIDVSRDPLAVRRKIGYLPEVAPLYDDMRTVKYLDFVARARGLSGTRLRDRLEWVFDAAHIREVLYKKVNALSKGYRQRVGLAQALVHDPEILILDEPTSGLDPRQIIDIRRLIHDLAATKTIIFSSHILAEISAVTNRIVIINEGRIVADGMIEQLRNQARNANRVLVELSGPNGEAADALRGIREVLSVEASSADSHAAFMVSSPVERDVRGEINELARARGWNVMRLEPVLPTLEEAFIALTGKEAVRS